MIATARGKNKHMGKIDVERLKEVLKAFNGHRQKAADYCGLSKTTVSKMIARDIELKEFRVVRNKRCTPIYCERETMQLFKSHLVKIQSNSEYRNASDEEKKKIEERIKKIFFDKERF